MTEFASEQTLMVDYVITQEDIRNFTIYLARNSPAMRRSRLKFQFGMPALWILVGLSLQLNTSAPILPMLAVASALWLLLSPKRWLSLILKQTQKLRDEGQNRYPLRQTLAISPAGIWVSNEDIESKMKWKLVEKIVTTESYLYFYVSGTTALIVPKNTFRSEAECESFVETARRYRETAAGLNIAM